jgi:type I restriction enzyme S subunit
MLRFRWETEFKETEIGEIPRDWEITNLGDNRFFKILPSGIKKFEGVKEYLSTSSVEGNEIVKIEEFITYNKRPSRANMQPVENSVWLARMINSPKFLKANEDLIENKILSTGFLGIQTKIKETCDYLFYYIQTKEFQEYKDAYVTGAVQESLTNENAKELLVILPPLPEQSRIATVLSYFDDLIEVKKRQNEILEKTAMAIFKSWFVDFEPFRACPEQERGNCEFVYNEELGKEIPKGWEVKKIGEVADLKNGLSYKGSEKFNEQIHGSLIFITLNNIIEGGGFKTEYAWIKSERIKNQHLLKEGDIIFANTEQTKTGRLLGTPAFVIFPTQYSKSVGVFSHHLTKINPKDFRMKYFFYLLFRLYQQEFAQSFHTGTGVWGFDLQNFKTNYLIPIPPSPILQSFHSLVEPLFQKIILNQKQIMTLRKIRDTLLPLLVFGKLRIEEV